MVYIGRMKSETKNLTPPGYYMQERYILCTYLETEDKGVQLVRVGEFSSIDEAKNEAAKKITEDRFVILTEVYFPENNW